MTYPELAEHYKVRLEDLDWTDRSVTRSGLRKFLILVWRYRQTRYHDEWEAVWRSNQFAYHEAMHVWHRRIPGHLSDTDRARVAWYLKQTLPLNDQKLRTKALRWSENRTSF